MVISMIHILPSRKICYCFSKRKIRISVSAARFSVWHQMNGSAGESLRFVFLIQTFIHPAKAIVSLALITAVVSQREIT